MGIPGCWVKELKYARVCLLKKKKKNTPEVSPFGKQLKIYNPVEICKGKNKKYNPNQPFRQPAN